MRTPDAIRIVMFSAAFAATPAFAFEMKETSAPPPAAAAPLAPLPPANVPEGNVIQSAPSGNTATASTDNALPAGLTPFQAFRTGTQAYLAGEKQKAVAELGYAAEQGHTLAAWKLGRMYAEGDGVKRNDLKAFQYFSKIASDNADISPFGPQARFVSNAFVAVGGYYQAGIPNTEVKADLDRAREMYFYAASYFGDPDGQYRLARLYLDDKSPLRDVRQGARWLSLAAHKGQHQAQALLGHMLFNGEAGLPHQTARGLMWLTLAREGAAAPEDGWIVQYYEDALAHASDEERGLATTYVQQWASSQR